MDNTHDSDPTQTMSPLEDPIRDGLKEDARRSQIVADTKSQRNTHLPIFKLPVEILCKIFQWTQIIYRMDTHNHHLPGLPSKDLSWIVVTRVCQHWRRAAWNEPALWKHPTLIYPKWMAFMLERSRMAGITVAIDEKSIVEDDMLLAIFSHVHHIAELHLTRVPSQTIERILQGIKTAEVPMLEKLCLDAFVYTGRLRVRANEHRIAHNDFRGATNFHYLELKGIDIAWTSPLLNSLTTLVLSDISVSSKPTPSQFRSMLERMPGLKVLTLRNAFPTEAQITADTNPMRRRIPLLYLKRLEMSSGLADWEFFFSSVAMPNKVVVIAGSIQIGLNVNPQFAKLLSAIGDSNTFAPLGTGAQTLTINTQGEAQFTFLTTGTKVHNGTALLLLLIPHTSTFVHAPYQFTNMIFEDYFNGLHWETLTELNISSLGIQRVGFSDQLARTFGTLPKLATAVVGSRSAKVFLDAMVIGSDKDPSLFPNSIVFPGLRHITFYEIYFENNDEEAEIRHEQILGCAMTRCEMGVELYSIKIECCRNLAQSDIDKIKEVVVEVVWDRSVDEDEDEDEDEEDDEHHSTIDMEEDSESHTTDSS